MSDDVSDRDVARATALRLVIRIMGIVFGFAALVTAVLGVAADSHPHVLAGWFLEAPLDQGTARLKFSALFLTMFFVAAALTILLMLAQRKLSADAIYQRARRQVEEARRDAAVALTERDDALKAHRQGMGALGRALAGWRKAAASEESWRYVRVEERYDVEADATTTSTRTYDLEAVEQVIGFRVSVSADETAAPADQPSDIEFTAHSMTSGREVEWAVVDNGPYAKIFALMFVPPLRPKQRIKFQIRHRWQGFTANLLEKGKTEFAFAFASAAETDQARVSMTFAFAAGLGPLDLTLSEGAPGRLSRRPSDESYDRSVWVYSAARMKMRGQQFSIDVARI